MVCGYFKFSAESDKKIEIWEIVKNMNHVYQEIFKMKTCYPKISNKYISTHFNCTEENIRKKWIKIKSEIKSETS